MDLISIIVPVYNSEKYLKKCLDSILSQTYSELEVILIDDGSQDNSGCICDEYANKDPRIKVIHKENAGVSKARNDGLEIASGEYIGFVDSDDWIEPEMYDKMMKMMKTYGVDIVKCLQNLVHEDRIILDSAITKDLYINMEIQRKKMVEDVIYNKIMPSFSLMLIKKRIIDEQRLRFDTDLIIGEDMLFALSLYMYAKSIYWCNDYFYNYYIHSNSSMRSRDKNKMMTLNLTVLYLKLEELFVKNQLYDNSLREELAKYFFYEIYSRTAKYVHDTRKDDIITNLIADKNFDSILNSINSITLSNFGKIILYFLRRKRKKICYILLFLYYHYKK